MKKINYFNDLEIKFNKNILHNRSCGVITINKLSNFYILFKSLHLFKLPETTTVFVENWILNITCDV